jgi:hypothetical protein
MKSLMKQLLALFVIGISATVVLAASRTISSRTAASGQPYPATAAVNAGTKFTCTNATQSGAKPGTPPPSCYVVGPGIAQAFPKNGAGAFSGPGTATLTCNGTGALTCSLRLDN